MLNIKKICGVLLCAGINFSVLAAEKNTIHDFSFPDAMSGKTFAFSKQSAQWTLLVFWRVDCEPCLADMPVLASFAAQNTGVRLLGISFSSREETRAQWQKMATPFPTLVNDGFPGALLEEYGNTLGAVPYTVLLQPDRKLCWSMVGKITPEKLQAALQQCHVVMLKATASAIRMPSTPAERMPPA